MYPGLCAYFNLIEGALQELYYDSLMRQSRNNHGDGNEIVNSPPTFETTSFDFLGRGF